LHLTKGLEVLIIGAVITLGAVFFGESATIAVGDIVPIVGLVVMLVGNQIRRNERKQQNVLC
jgi:xanthosine utilization system XapX-like protein